jgi:hypothetical protein
MNHAIDFRGRLEVDYSTIRDIITAEKQKIMVKINRLRDAIERKGKSLSWEGFKAKTGTRNCI